MVNKLHSKYKILTWNILYSPNFLERLPEIARLIKNSKADIALLQEINTAYTVEAVAAFDQIGYKLHLDDKLGKRSVSVSLITRLSSPPSTRSHR